jgi:hypothetical protein
VGEGKVVATCVIDFPFADFGNGTLNLAKHPEERLLERMYCFKDMAEDRRVVLHVHTLLEWGGRGKLACQDRAVKVTSANVRHAEASAGKWTQDGNKMELVPVAATLQTNWRQKYKSGHGNMLEWKWVCESKVAGGVPTSEERNKNVFDTYEQVRYATLLILPV